MKMRALFVLYWAAMTLAGCGAPPATLSTSPAPPNLTGNWQIQSSAIAGVTQPAGVLLLGALQGTGSQVSGTFRFSNLAQPTQCGLNQVVNVSGSIDSKNNLAVISSALPNGDTVKIALAINAAQSPYYSGTIEVDGSTCAFPSAAALGGQIASVSGTFSGTLAPGPLLTPGSGPSAAVSLALSQSATPQVDGQFPVAGTLNYSIGSCTGSMTLSGTVSGVGLMLSAPGAPPANLPYPAFIGGVNPTAATITAGFLSFEPAPCSTEPFSSATYNGTLNRQ